MSTSPTQPLSYASYLKLDALLQLQSPLSNAPEHDELLFISIHQVYELWFKQVLHEAYDLRAALFAADANRVLARFKRILTIFKTLVAQVDVLETMTPLSFNAFRARLEASSGFQSAQFRELEFLLGARDARRLAVYPEGSAERSKLIAALNQPSLYQAFLAFLAAQGADLPAAALGSAAATGAPVAAAELHPALIAVYRAGGFAAQVAERMVDLDEALQEWRYRHVKMVERTIGSKPGSGGSSGAEYLKRTLFTPLFPDLWAIRSEL
jgi:tryptophan 2,3-dioxygenase